MQHRRRPLVQASQVRSSPTRVTVASENDDIAEVTWASILRKRAVIRDNQPPRTRPLAIACRAVENCQRRLSLNMNNPRAFGLGRRAMTRPPRDGVEFSPSLRWAVRRSSSSPRPEAGVVTPLTVTDVAVLQARDVARAKSVQALIDVGEKID